VIIIRIEFKCALSWNTEEVFNIEVVYMHMRLIANGVLKYFLFLSFFFLKKKGKFLSN